MLILTDKSLYLLAFGAVILFPSANYPVFISVFLIYIILILLLILIDYIRILSNFGITIERKAEKRLSSLDDNPVELALSYRKGISLSLELMESGMGKFVFRPQLLKTEINPYTIKTLKYCIVPITRGDFKFEAVHIRARSIMGFVTVQRRFPLPKEVRVVPNVRAVTKYKLLTRHPMKMPGERIVRRMGQGTAFRELRDYFPGDEYRRIDWKSTARRGKLTVKEYEDERSQNLMILIDTGRMMTSFIPRGKKEAISLLGTDIFSEDLPPWENPLRETTRLDFTVNASLVLSYVALSKGDNVGLMAFSSKRELFLPPRSGKAQITRIVNMLYGLKPKLVESDYRSMFIDLAHLQRRRSLVIFFTDLIDVEASRNLIKYILSLHPRHTILVVAFRDAEITEQAQAIPKDNSELYDIAVAKDILYNRELALHELRRGGAMTLDLYPEELSVKVVAEYLRLKSRIVI